MKLSNPDTTAQSPIRMEIETDATGPSQELKFDEIAVSEGIGAELFWLTRVKLR